MTDKIFIDGLEIFANHGALREENVLGQKFVVSVSMECDMREAGKGDDLSKSVNYADVCTLIEKSMKDSTYKLIEAAAENIAEKILMSYDRVKSVTVNLKKPWAPILMNVNTVGVEITRLWHTSYIALGSNMGDRRAHLSEAVKSIESSPRCRVKKVSDFIETKPVGGVEQEDFLNGCMEIQTLYTPHELLDFLHEIENAHHRERKIHWGPRTLDLDIILYDDIIMNNSDLTIPHPESTKREFVLEPLNRIAPYAYHPAARMYISELFDKIH
ncbi:MAG: 2-amino-4-hydroxy-6-hydroxymethyldihydropteridine diphosphokinase [Oscillospiraceae bacterium]|nr:2-amino-4-hydroxy-6-hydroxymethyldihydropteridine diphosphokinase [Oscillospiraceae bacterium]